MRNIASASEHAERPTAVYRCGGSSAALHLLAPVALVALLGGALLSLLEPAETLETILWVLAFAVALPAGVAIAGRHARALAPAPQSLGWWATALGTLAIAASMVVRERGGEGTAEHVTIALAGLLTIGIPFGLARDSSVRRRLCAAPRFSSTLVLTVALLVLGWPFVEGFRPQRDGLTRLAGHVGGVVALGGLVVAMLAAGAVLTMVLRGRGVPKPRISPRILDAAAIVALALLVLAAPDLSTGRATVLHHHNFFLGPANDVLHGRTVLVDVFSQYGVGVIDALALVFQIVPVGYGGLVLIISLATVAIYVLTYTTLRAAVGSPVLVACGMAVAVLTNILMQPWSYTFFPSIGPLRFGWPYVLIASAVFAARFVNRAQTMRLLGLSALAVAAVWSFETFVYTATVYVALALLDAYGRPGVDLRAGFAEMRRRIITGAIVTVGAFLLLSLTTVALSGRLPVWGGYLDYLGLYTASGLGQLPVVWFSPGPMMGLAVFLSAAGVVWVSRHRSVPAPLLVAITRFTAFAVASFTYYLGRSHPNNLLHLMIPIAALGTLWAALLLEVHTSGGTRSALLGAASLLIIGATIAVSTPEHVKARLSETAVSQVVLSVSGGSEGTDFGLSLKRLWDQPVIDPRSEEAARILERLEPSHRPVLVLTEPELTTEILLRSGRRNVLPIANPMQNRLVMSPDAAIFDLLGGGQELARVRDSLRSIRPGTLLLISRPHPAGAKTELGAPRDLNALQQFVRENLRRRFAWITVIAATDGLRVVRLIER